MANTFLTNDIVTYEALDVLENTYNVLAHINSEYSDQFKFGGAVDRKSTRLNSSH